MKKQVTLFADDGMMITDGKHYGTTISVEVGADDEKYYEITIEEYNERQEQNKTETEIVQS